MNSSLISIGRLHLGVFLLAVLGGLVACATERQPAAIAAPSPTTSPPGAATEVAPTSIPTSRAATSGTVLNTPTMTVPPITVASATATATATATPSPTATRWSAEPHPLQIEVMRQQTYPGSEIVFEQTLEPADSYDSFVVSYQSEGYKIYALMTIPNGARPDTGWPVIVFNHGYVRPSVYSTTGNYVPYMEMLSSSGYIVFKSDYRGHGRSDGAETVGGGYGLPDYTADVLNAVASLQAYPDADPERIGMWGHSMGGQITLRAMVVSDDIKAGVIWAGVVSPYPDIIARWDFTRNLDFPPEMVENMAATPESSASNWLRNFSSWVNDFAAQYGEPDENPAFWDTISPNSYLADLSGPLQLHHSTTDPMVPLAWSETLVAELDAAANTTYEFFTYPDDNHDLVVNYGTAMRRTVEFFDRYVKEDDSMKINITLADTVMTATLADNQTARDFISLLPLTLTLEDYAGTEKISRLPERLSTADAPSGSDPAVGDITYYAPWGNLAIFYQDFGYASGLVILGKIDGDVDALRVPGSVNATIELVKEKGSGG